MPRGNPQINGIPQLIMTEGQIGWLAGIIEGEGCIRIKNGKNPSVIVEMTDRDIIDRLQTLTAGGTISERKKKQVHHKQSWCWSLCARKDVARILLAIYPYMSYRKKTKIGECADAFLAPRNPGKRKNLRPCGTIAAARRHYSNGEKPCEPCRITINLNNRLYRKKK